jgi:uroporphyrinogen-III synthase
VPAIEIRETASGGPLDAALVATEPSDWVVLTSASAARVVLGALARVGVEPTSLRWAAVGEATARVLHEAKVDDVFIPSEPNGVALARELPLDARSHVLVPRADIADGQVVDVLRERGAVLADVVAYETGEAPESSRRMLAAAVDDGPVDAVILTSGSSARGILALASDAARPGLAATPVIAAGASTASAARAAGYTNIFTAPSPVAADLAAFAASALGVADASLHDQPADDLDPTGAVR